MNHYLFQASYTSEAWQTLLKKPENRAEAIRPFVQELGGDVTISWVCAGDYDLLVVMSLPDDAAALTASMAFNAGGALRQLKYTRLYSWQQGLEAMEKAGRAGYRPPWPPRTKDV